MPKKGYKQTEEHKAKIGAARAEPRKKIAVEKKPPVFRDFRCATYHKCLANAARFDLVLDCTDCPNRRHRIPRGSDIYFEMLTEEVERCGYLLKAIFHPDAWLLEERAKQKAVEKGLVKEDEVEEVDWQV